MKKEDPVPSNTGHCPPTFFFQYTLEDDGRSRMNSTNETPLETRLGKNRFFLVTHVSLKVTPFGPFVIFDRYYVPSNHATHFLKTFS